MKRVKLEIRKSYLVKFVDPNKKYTVSYLAHHQSETGKKEFGLFNIIGKDLTENQILELFKNEKL
jgi:hypothetical protein